MSRITSARTGTGDTGYSNLSSGLRVRKSNSICSFQNHLQLFSNALRSFITSDKFKSVSEYDQIFIESLVNPFVNDLSASIYFNFENANYGVSDNLKESLEIRLSVLNEKVKETTEFVIFEKDLLVLEQVLIYTRQVEHLFWVTVDQNNFYNMTTENKKEKVTKDISYFLNALSDYFFLLIRSLSSEVTYWQK